MNQNPKGHGYYRKSKAYGLVCGIALSGALMVSTQAKADELVEVTPAVTITANPATNLPEAQPETPAVNTALANEAGTQTGEMVSDLVSPSLDQAVAKATETGVGVSAEAKVTHDNLASAQADLAKQETAVKEATAKQEANTTAITNAVNENKAIDKANADEKARVDALNKQGEADTKARNEAGQKAVDQANAKAKADADAENTKRQADYDKAVADREAVVASNTAKEEKYTADQAEYEAKLAEYERQKADYDKKKAEYDKAVATQGTNNAEYQKAKAEYDKAKAEYDVAKAEYDVAKETYLREKSELLREAEKTTNSEGYLSKPFIQNLIYRSEPNARTSITGNVQFVDPAYGAPYFNDGTFPTVGEAKQGIIGSARFTHNSQYPLLSDQAMIIVPRGGTFKTISEVQNTYFNGRKIARIENEYTLVNAENAETLVAVFRDPTENIKFGSKDTVYHGHETKWRFIPRFFYEDGTQVNFSEGTALIALGSMNAGRVPSVNHDDYHEFTLIDGNFEFIPINGSAITLTSGNKVRSDGTDIIVENEDPSSPYYGWDKDKSPKAYRGAAVLKLEGTNPVLEFGANYDLYQWWTFNADLPVPVSDEKQPPKEPKAPTPPKQPEGNVPQAPKPPVKPTPPTPPQLEDVPPMPEKPQFVTPVVKTFTPEVYVPLEPKVTPHVPVPNKENHTVKVHPVDVKQTPTNVKAVENSDKVSVNGQLVPKNDLITWTLTNTPLKAGRDEVTRYVMTDPIPAGFVLDNEATAEANPAWIIATDEAGALSIFATPATLSSLNADLTKDVTIPVVSLIGRPVNDGGTYENTFKTIVTTPKGEYTTVSNTPKIYTPGDDSRTYNGQVIVRYRTEDGDLEIRKDVLDVEDGKVGSPYDTTDNRPDVLAFEGKLYKRTPKVVGNETGQVVKGKTYVTYYYKLVPNTPDTGTVIVHYEDEEGTPIKNDVVDTPDAPVGTDYSTLDNRPKKIKTNDGVEYELVPNKTRGKEDGKVVSGITEVTYVYKRLTPKPPTPTPTDNLIKPKKDVVDDKGVSINGKQVLPNTPINYVLTQDFDQYKGMTASKEAIGKGFVYVDDYLDEALDGKSLVVKSITAKNGDDVSSLLEMYHVLSKDSLDERLAEIVKASGISPVGEFYLWVAKNPEDFFKAYVQKGLDVTYNLSFKIKDKFVGKFTNQSFQIDFGNGYYGNVVSNEVPELKVNKDVMIDGKAVDKGEIALGDTFEYTLEGWVIPADRGYDIKEYRFIDIMQSSHDDYKGFSVKAKVDITLADGTVIEKGTDLSEYVVQTYDVKTGKFELTFKGEFLAQIPRTSAFGSDVLLKAERIKSGTVENEFILYVNGIPVKSDKVVTKTPEPPKPPQPEEPKEVPPTPVTPPAPKEMPKKALPQTGDATSVLGMVGAFLSGFGLAGLKRRKKD